MSFGDLLNRVSTNGKQAKWQRELGKTMEGMPGTSHVAATPVAVAGAVPQAESQPQTIYNRLRKPSSAPAGTKVTSKGYSSMDYGPLNPYPDNDFTPGLMNNPDHRMTWKENLFHAEDAMPDLTGAPSSDPIYQLYGDAAPSIFKTINKGWGMPKKLGEKVGDNKMNDTLAKVMFPGIGKLGNEDDSPGQKLQKMLITGNPFNLFR